MKRMLTTLAFALAIVAPAFAAEDAKTIARQMNDKWLESYNKEDAAGLAGNYTSDAALMPQGSPQPIIGQANIRKYFEDTVKEHVENLSLPVTDAKMLDQKTLFAAGTWSGAVRTEKGGGPAMPLKGTYLIIAVTDGSSWRLQADTWNMIQPTEMQPSAAQTPPTGTSGSSMPNK